VRREDRASGRPQPPSRPATHRTRTARQPDETVSTTLRRVRAALRGLFAGAQRAVRRMGRWLSSWVAPAVGDRASKSGGVQRVALAALQAVLAGRNPVVAAIKAGFLALSAPMKILVIAGLVLLALLAPLLLMLLLLALAVALVVIAVRAPATA